MRPPRNKILAFALANVLVANIALDALAEANFWEQRHAAVTSQKPAEPDSRRTVIIFEDIHAQPDAQKNISERLVDLEQRRLIDLIGVEGEFKPYDFGRFDAFPDGTVTRRAADDFLNAGLLGAASHAGIVAGDARTRMIGVDAPDLYWDNVAAYRTARRFQKTLHQQNGAALSAWEKDLLAHASAAVIDFELAHIEWKYQRIPLRSYLEKLETNAPPEGQIRSLLRALRLEDLLRSASLQAATPHRAENLKIKSTYARDYQTLIAGIDSSMLLAEMDRVADIHRRAIERNQTDRDIVETGKNLQWVRALSRLELTSYEWPNPTAFTDAGLRPFERFYELADQRSAIMADRLLSMPGWRNAALVVGGFHVEKIAERLRRAGCSVRRVIPKTPDVHLVASIPNSLDRTTDPFERAFAAPVQALNDNRVVGVGASSIYRTAALLASIAVLTSGGVNRAFRNAGVIVERSLIGFWAAVSIDHVMHRVHIYFPNEQFGLAVSHPSSWTFEPDEPVGNPNIGQIRLWASIFVALLLAALTESALSGNLISGIPLDHTAPLHVAYRVFRPFWVALFLGVSLYFMLIDPIHAPYRGNDRRWRIEYIPTQWKHLANVVIPLLPTIGAIVANTFGFIERPVLRGIIGLTIGAALLIGMRLILSKGKRPAANEILIDVLVNQPLLVMVLSEFSSFVDTNRSTFMVLNSLFIGLISVTWLPSAQWQNTQRRLKVKVRPSLSRFLSLSLIYMDWLVKIFWVPYTKHQSTFNQGLHDRRALLTYMIVWACMIGLSYCYWIPLGATLFITGYVANALEKTLWHGAVDPIVLLNSTVNIADFLQWIGISLITVSVFNFVVRWHPWKNSTNSEERLLKLIREERLTPFFSRTNIPHFIFWAAMFGLMGTSLYQGRVLLSENPSLGVKEWKSSTHIDEDQLQILRAEMSRATKDIVMMHVSVEMTPKVEEGIRHCMDILEHLDLSSLHPFIITFSKPRNEKEEALGCRINVDSIVLELHGRESLEEGFEKLVNVTIPSISDRNSPLSRTRIDTLTLDIRLVIDYLTVRRRGDNSTELARFYEEEKNNVQRLQAVEEKQRHAEPFGTEEQHRMEQELQDLESLFTGLTGKNTTIQFPPNEADAEALFQEILTRWKILFDPAALTHPRPAAISSPAARRAAMRSA